MSGFSIAWLDLREPADRRARDQGVKERAWRFLEDASDAGKRPVVVDIGAGSGSTLRAFASPHSDSKDSGVRPCWHLVDHDRNLLAEARRRHAAQWQMETHVQDLLHVEGLPLADCRLITASALLDLVSANYVDALLARLKALNTRQPVGLYAALNYDGTTHWEPGHGMDGAVLSAFNRDQRRDKGFGPALGPDAGRYLEQASSRDGFTVLTAPSPWELTGRDSELLLALIEGMGAALVSDEELDQEGLRDWIDFRKTHAPSGSCIVGHVDLLLLPQ